MVVLKIKNIEITPTHVGLLRNISQKANGFVWQKTGFFRPSLDDTYCLGEYGGENVCSKMPTQYFVDVINAGLLKYHKHDYPNNILKINRKWKSTLGIS